MIEEIQEFSFIYRPFDNSFPINECIVIIRAKNRKEAELIALDYKHKFFNLDCTCEVKEGYRGYRKI